VVAAEVVALVLLGHVVGLLGHPRRSRFTFFS